MSFVISRISTKENIRITNRCGNKAEQSGICFGGSVTLQDPERRVIIVSFGLLASARRASMLSQICCLNKLISAAEYRPVP